MITFKTSPFSPITYASVFLGMVLSSCCAAPPDYVRDVQPILSHNCFACHGADEESREADLRLDQPSDNSALGPELIARITSSDPELRMPPPDSGHSLTPHQIDLVRRWVEAGAEYATHWSFVPPVRPEIPAVDDGNRDWSRSPIDHFISLRLSEQKLSPSPSADPYTLVRRVWLDLTGLPPTVAEADAFAADPSDEAYAQIVQQLLESPAFGEHWARMWLDLARYADTKGYEKDQPRDIWRYRDWVIESINDDMPFDQFTVEQIAGDLLENPDTNQILATAFHRNTMTNDEGGTDNEEFRIAAVKDRVDTTVQVWMGLTMGCAKCHSHKYDPITQQEYYQFLAMFNQTEDADRSDDAPRHETPTASQKARTAELLAQISAAEEQYAVTTPEFLTAQRAWESELAGGVTWQTAQPATATSANKATLKIQDDRSILVSGKLPATDVYSVDVTVNQQQPVTAIRLEALTDDSLPKNGPGRRAADTNFVLNELTGQVIMSDGSILTELKFDSASADFSQDGWEVSGAIDGKQETGWAISPQQGQPHVAVFRLATAVAVASDQPLRLQLSQQYASGSLLLGRFRISTSVLPTESLAATLSDVNEIAAIPESARTDAQKQELDAAFRKIAPQTAEAAERLQQLRKELSDHTARISRTPVMKELPERRRRETFIHTRGNFRDPGEKVDPGLPAQFAFTDGAQDRLSVARWLVSGENPLTARVFVNRVWARLFGRGLVETEEDFGTQGSLPTHPQLLDWLAMEFRETHRWSLRELCRAVVTSSTYRQSAKVDEDRKRTDPSNQWLSRVPRFRLPAETIRDQALAVSGLLSSKIGGPSVMPPQPGGIWRTTYSTLKWETSADEDRYRRGLYTFLRRTSPYPSLITFDAGSREVCQIRRIRTNTPLQALITMNDPVYVEAAGALAMEFSSSDNHEWISQMFRRVLIRPPSEAESQKLSDYFRQTLAEYDAQPELAMALIKAAGAADVQPKPETASAADLAARVAVASVLLNLDETLMRP